MPEGSIKDGIGASVRRKEDKRFLTGSGRYTADITGRDSSMFILFARSTRTPTSRRSAPQRPKRPTASSPSSPASMSPPTALAGRSVAGL